MERREAPAFSKEGAAKRKTGAPLGAPSPRARPEGRKGKTAYPGPQRIRAMSLALARTGQARRARRWLARRSFSEGGLFEN